MTDSLVSFGSNLAGCNGDIASTLMNVRARLAEFKEIGTVRVSRGYRTPAFPAGSGPDFLNAALAFPTTLAPADLLALLHAIEAGMGRVRRRRWEPRTCDLDLLAVGDTVLPDMATVGRWMALADGEAMARTPGELLLPHPRLHRRAFVLVPLAEVAPDWRHPVLGQSAGELVAALDPRERAAIGPWPAGASGR